MGHTSRQFVLAARPQGRLSEADFAVRDVEIGPLREGSVLVRNLWMSVDPYMRRRMNDGPFYVPPFEVGRPLSGGAVGVVIESASEIPVGTTVQHNAGWRDLAALRSEHAIPVDTDIAPAAAYLGVLGMPGLTAWAGLLKIAELKKDDVVFVSGAAGSVGSLAGQLAKLRGNTVIGSAGSPEKVEWLTQSLGFDAAFDYRGGDLRTKLESLAPFGIDVYFDNVGGDHLEAALWVANTGARFALCGSISDYDSPTPVPGPSNLFEVISRRVSMRGFIVFDHDDSREHFLADVAHLVASGAITYRETVVDGLENAPRALMSLFEGANTGKMLVRLSER